ncbi:MAG: hypothetical protein HC860_10060 [Alkalinema sp. RU_4_3]|nr:hypothetical protein [Alkalinema sp. RU_4_3]
MARVSLRGLLTNWLWAWAMALWMDWGRALSKISRQAPIRRSRWPLSSSVWRS